MIVRRAPDIYPVLCVYVALSVFIRAHISNSILMTYGIQLPSACSVKQRTCDTFQGYTYVERAS